MPTGGRVKLIVLLHSLAAILLPVLTTAMTYPLAKKHALIKSREPLANS